MRFGRSSRQSGCCYGLSTLYDHSRPSARTAHQLPTHADDPAFDFAVYKPEHKVISRERQRSPPDFHLFIRHSSASFLDHDEVLSHPVAEGGVAVPAMIAVVDDTGGVSFFKVEDGPAWTEGKRKKRRDWDGIADLDSLRGSMGRFVQAKRSIPRAVSVVTVARSVKQATIELGPSPIAHLRSGGAMYMLSNTYMLGSRIRFTRIKTRIRMFPVIRTTTTSPNPLLRRSYHTRVRSPSTFSELRRKELADGGTWKWATFERKCFTAFPQVWP